MNTLERAEILAQAAGAFPLLGSITTRDLLETVRLELGHAEILDGFRDHGGHLSRAIAPETILHIVSGNTPHAALQSVMRGLLLGSHNRVKLPSCGIEEAVQFRAALPPGLAEKVELSRDLPDAWLRGSDAWIVFGSDETIAHFQSLPSRPGVFVSHGHKVSLLVIFDDPEGASVPRAAADVSLFDQKGCLSPHAVYVAGDSRSYAERLAAAMEQFDAMHPRQPLSAPEEAEIMAIRAAYQFRAASDPRVRVWAGKNWTVIHDEEPRFAASCLNRVVFVKPLPDDLASALAPVRQWIGGIGIWPATLENAERVAILGTSRICRVGEMQQPPFSWHQDGAQTLASLVRWVDFQPEAR